MVLELVRAYSDAATTESPEFQSFCSGCDYVDRRDACPRQTRIQAFEHNVCDWSMMNGVGAMPRTGATLAIWDPSQGSHVVYQRSDKAAVREAISRNLRLRPSNL